MVSRNKEQMRRFTEQQVHDIVVKENSEPGQTFQQQQILEQEQPDTRWAWQVEKQQEEEKARARERDAMVKEDGFVDMFKQNAKTKVAQEAATYVVKKAIEKLPGIIACRS